MRASLRIVGTLALGAIATVLVVGATPAAAGDDPPVSGDERATVYPGNIKDGDCAAAGLAGSKIEVGVSIEANTYITITSVPEGTTLTGVVVKGSDAYNVYPAGVTTGLHAPLAGKSGAPAQISHWFACGTTTTPTTTTSTTTTTTSTTTTGSTTTTTGGTTTTTTAPTSTTETGGTTTSSAPGGTTATSPTSPGGSDDDDLASTGASVFGLLGAGLALLALGGGLFYLNRRRALG